MSIGVFSSELNGSDWTPLDTLGTPSALSFSSQWPGGDLAFTMSVDVSAAANPKGLRLGRKITILDGPAPVWCGIMADPQRGSPWQITGQGLASLAERFLCLTTPSGGASTITVNANTAVAQAISRGLPWTLNSTLPTPTVTPDQPDLQSLLDAVAQASGQRWAVDQRGFLTMAADPTTPAYLLISSNTPGGRTIDGYATAVWAVNGTTTYPATKNPASGGDGPFGRWERAVDGTSATIADNALTLARPDPAFSGTLTVVPGDLLTLGGTPVRLATVRAGAMVKMIGLQPDPITGQAVFSVSSSIVIGEWDYDAIADTAQLTPLGSTRQDITTLLAAAAATTLQGAGT